MNKIGNCIVRILIVIAPLCANAGTLYDQPLSSPEGTYYGSGNVNAGWTITTTDGLELGLRAKNRFGTTSVIHPDTNHYWVPVGTQSGKAMFNFDFSINLINWEAWGENLQDISARMTFTDLATGHSVSIDPLKDISDNAGWGYPDTPSDPGYGSPVIVHNGSNLPGLGGMQSMAHITLYRAQNSENPMFTPFSSVFDPVRGCHECKLDLTVYQNSDPNPIASNTIFIESAPEPASLLLFGGGLVVIGTHRRRKSTKVA